ncbi:transposase [Jeotgalibacillus soli]|uniref:Transposase IS200-like domain-containing protein n=1 Tax=Jeotgalibacillus soli TaxID=889306 RepID=A0A0C2VZW1_9BACL|nr:transposase [Jeotgalibacillus soli]KIL49906.1 hypothetical protein KP78_13740 [Jeotgalibacillus soli]
MARGPRIWIKDGVYHIIVRGNRRMKLFGDRRDFRTYLAILRKTKNVYSYDLLAYCLMDNHVHLLIQYKEDSPSAVMKMLNGEYARYFNLRRQEIGHVFQGRFYSKLVTGSFYLLDACRYIHQNPMKANISFTLADYPWSSYNAYLTSNNPNNISTNLVLQQFPHSQRTHYEIFMHENL